MKLTILTAALALLAAPAHAEFLSVGEFLDHAQSKTEVRYMFAAGFAAGVWDAGTGVHICGARNLSVKNLLDLSKAIAARAERSDMANEVLTVGYKALFPCNRGQTL